MDLTRRDFLGVTATAAVASLQRIAGTADDPLGVRKDFPALRDYTFLNTAYTGLISQAVVDAAREWTDTRARPDVHGRGDAGQGRRGAEALCRDVRGR